MRLAYRERGEDEENDLQEKKAPMIDINWTDEQQRNLQGGGNAIVGDGEAIDEDEPLTNGGE